MSAEIRTFIPRADKTASENLAAFVDLCRNHLTVFGANLEFGKEKWEITEAVNTRGHGNKLFRITFCSLRTAGARRNTTPLLEPYQSFAKSYIRYSQGVRPVDNQQQRMTSLRAVEEALIRVTGEANPIRIDQSVLNVAIKLVQETQSPGVAYRVGIEMAHFATFLADNCLVSIPVSWRNPLRRPEDQNIRFGKEYEDRRAEKLPDQEALEALPVAYQKATTVQDVVATSAAGLLITSPDRINEVLMLPVACERQVFAKGEMRYGLEWVGSKGYKDGINWLKGPAIDLAKECIQKLVQVTEPAREIARWYESNPNQVYLPSELSYLRSSENLTDEELLLVVGLTKGPKIKATVNQWCKNNGVSIQSTNGERRLPFKEVEAAIIKMLPPKFPILDVRTGLKYSEAIFIARKYEMGESKGMIYKCMIEPISINQINNTLGASVEHGKGSVFVRLNMKNSNGEYHQLKSHEFRHYLNTLAQIGGASELDIALWSKRKDLKHNATYDHMSNEKILEKMRDFAEADTSLPVALRGSGGKKALIRRTDFVTQAFPAAHATDFGWCVHDYASLPCQQHRDCINCNEQVCVKGVTDRLENVRKAREISEALLGRHLEEQADRTYGASRWVKHEQLTLERLIQLEALLSDPRIPDGAPIRLNIKNQPTLMRTALEGRAEKIGDIRLDVSELAKELPSRNLSLPELPIKTSHWEVAEWRDQKNR